MRKQEIYMINIAESMVQLFIKRILLHVHRNWKVANAICGDIILIPCSPSPIFAKSEKSCLRCAFRRCFFRLSAKVGKECTLFNQTRN